MSPHGHRPSPRQGAVLALLTASLCLPATAQAATTSATSAAAAPAATVVAPTSNAYSAYSSGDVVFANAADLPPADVAVASTGQSAAGVGQNGGPLVTTDQLSQRLLTASAAGRTAYGHGSGVNAGLLGAAGDPPQVAATRAEATSPAPGTGAAAGGTTVPVAPLLTADVLPGAAAAATPADSSCLIGKDSSAGTSRIANATVLDAGGGTVVGSLGGTSTSTSRTALVRTAAAPALLAQTTQTLAPLTLFAGTPLALRIDVLRDLQLSVEAGGTPGSSTVSYGAVGASGTTPVLSLTLGGQTVTLTSQQVFGGSGLVLPLGVADVVIGGPAHALTGLPGTAPTTAADGTTASAAADFVRVTLPGQLPVATTTPLGTGPLAPLNAVLAPVVNGAAPLLTPLQPALTSAGLDVADVRQGHLEAAATVPAGGITCAAAIDPLGESVKDVSARRVSPGATFDYDLRVPNRGTQPLTAVTAVDTYLPGLELVGAVPAPTSAVGRTLTFGLGTLQPGEFRTVVLTFRVPTGTTAGTAFSNRATITGDSAGTPLTHVVAVAGPLVVPAATAGACDLHGSRISSSNTSVVQGQTVGYFVTVLNAGSSACRTTTITQQLPPGTTFVSCTASCTHSGDRVTWHLGTIAPGSSRVVDVIVRVTATSGRLPSTAVVDSPGGRGARPSTPGPLVTSTSRAVPVVPADAVFAVGSGTPPGELPTTGLPTAAVLAGLLLLLSATGLRRLGRRA